MPRRVPPREVDVPQAQSHAASVLIGRNPEMVELHRLIARVAASPARTVLVFGETGTGKSLVARLLHELSPRAQAPYVDVNCAAIPGSLLESELFGHERGAFTGAVTRKAGLLEVGDRGTVLLDEIREMGLELQAKLLTLLDNGRFRRIGGIDPIEVDVRFVATTNTILLSQVREGRFREDLYYRLQLVSINIPPLRERGDDILVLTEHLLDGLNARYASYGRRITGLDAQAEAVFRAYRWPGNVRELQNLLERIFILESGTRIRLEHLPPRILREVEVGRAIAPRQPWATAAAGDGRAEPVVASPGGASGADRAPVEARPAPEAAPSLPTSLHEATDALHRQLIEAALARSRGRLGSAATLLGLSRHALRHYMRKLGLG